MVSKVRENNILKPASAEYTDILCFIGYEESFLEFYRFFQKLLRESEKNTLVKGNGKLRFQADAGMSKSHKTRSAYFPAAPDGQILCPDFRGFTKLLSVHVRTFVRSLKFFVFVGFLSVHVQNKEKFNLKTAKNYLVKEMFKLNQIWCGVYQV